MKPTLLDKLRMIDAPRAKDAGNAADDNARNGVVDAAPAPAAAPLCACWRDARVYPRSLLAGEACVTPDVLSLVYGADAPADDSAPSSLMENLLFIDTETTGLSGGAGTVAFLIGAGYARGGEWIVEQFVMRDYPEETPMLAAFLRLAERFTALVTFNGKSYDLPLLRSRLTISRLDAERLPETHMDALHAARRVWKRRLNACSLGALESAVLGVSRDADLPGADVPKRYFAYLKSRDLTLLDDVLAHNRQDVTSLAQLFCRIACLYARPESVREPDDLFSMARALERRGQADAAMRIYQLTTDSALRAETFSAMARAHVRARRDDAAAALYRAMIGRGEGGCTPYVALAKLCEHRLRDVEQALAYTRSALMLLSEPTLFSDAARENAVQEERNALQYRYARLSRKLMRGR